MIAAISTRLGERTAALYSRISDLVSLAADARDEPARAALAGVGLATLRGEYHDYRAGHPLPKGDLVEALRRARSVFAEVSASVGRLIDDVVRGDFADGPAESARLIKAIAPARTERAAPVRGEAPVISLTDREYRVFVWLFRYCELYSQSPTMMEIASGLDTTTLAVADVIRALDRKGAVARLGGKRGVVPLRAP